MNEICSRVWTQLGIRLCSIACIFLIDLNHFTSNTVRNLNWVQTLVNFDVQRARKILNKLPGNPA